jgi:plastocyanin
MRLVRLIGAGLLVCVLIAAVACGGDDDDSSDDDGGEPTATANGETVSVDLSAEDNTFSTDEINVPPGAHLTITFENMDAVPHNFAVYESTLATEEIYVGETITGPDQSTTYEFDAPAEPGEYFFRCDIHPVEMVGDLIVE